MRFQIFISRAILVMFLTSCQKDSNSPGEAPPHVFLAVTQQTGSQSVVQYFKDSIATTIDPGPGYNYSNTIIANGEDIYISGNELTTYLGDTITHAKYWKNGNAVVLGDLSNRTISNGMSVDGNDIYVAGNNGWKAVYWKNGLEVNLDTDTLSSNATGIVASQSDVYVCGYKFNPYTTYTRAFCMKNGVLLPLQKDSGAVAAGIFIDGSDVYVCGSFQNDLTNQQACYWKNGSLVKLSQGSNFSNANSIFVSNGIAYVCGSVFNTAAYWFAGQEHLLEHDDKNTYARSIAVYGNDVYVAGSESSPGLIDFKATYWKNGSLFLIGDDSGQSGASSVFLQK